MLLFWQAGDVAFSVPNSLVVTLERVLGNETVGEGLYRFFFSHFFFSSSDSVNFHEHLENALS